jgi:hypothetical protein
MGPFEKSAGKPLGSLMAYISGKEVLVVRRVPGAHSPGGPSEAKSWSQADAAELAWQKVPQRNPFDVLLDLDGMTAERALLDSPTYPSVLRPGGLAILALDLEDSGITAFCGELQKSFSLVLPMDRLFLSGMILPGPPPARVGDSGVSAEARPGRLHFLCRN